MWRLYSRKHKAKNNWKSQNYLFKHNNIKQQTPQQHIFTQYKPIGDKILITSNTHKGWLCEAKYGINMDISCIAIK